MCEVMKVRILVAYASRYGSTAGIAERIAATLKLQGLDSDVMPVEEARELERYDAFVIGSAAYMGSWMKGAAQFVRRNRTLLSGKPVWLFSSGPIGTATVDAKGRDVRIAAAPKEFDEFADLKPRDHRVFFGALERAKLTGTHRLISRVPASQKILLEGDFRDWKEIDGWAEGIAHELAPVPVEARARIVPA
jgi:menaquinone-dependent protoporphyrinogen oxidase